MAESVSKVSSIHVEPTKQPDPLDEAFEGLSERDTQALEKRCTIISQKKRHGL